MSINETRSQNSTAIITVGGDAEVIDDTPDWKGPLTEYDHYGEPAGHNYVRYPMCGAEVLDDETSAASRQPACCYE